ncbi:MAG: hypothetical protein ACTHZX_02125 [Microbacterium sp.]
MEENTLVHLGQKTQTESEDLGTLVRRLAQAAEPLQGTFNGRAKGQFNSFKSKTDSIATALNSALAGIVGSIAGQGKAFAVGAEEGAETHAQKEGASDFSSEGLLARIAPQA